ncbi:MAG: hypothetical protein K8M05_17220 [Deltaproteobacteria bacterium]|nr:hypothetical protein [Kofleriaceae bacterium]
MRSKLSIVVVAGVVLITGLVIQQNACSSDDGWPPHDGNIRQTVRLDAYGLRRGGEGTVTLTATANFTRKAADVVDSVPVPGFSSIALALVDGKGVATPLPVQKWESQTGSSRGTVKLPEVPDGDYKLRASYRTRAGAGDVEANLPLYTPARIHVITDRPLYEPGNVVRFRAVVLRARDLAPLDSRPGRWIVKDPDGEVLLEESSPAGEWGVVAGTFPLDKGAPTGTWRIAWVSADASDEVPFTVEPFTLPRFRVEAAADKPYYRPLDTPVVRGAVVYSSGAPVTGAELAIEWDIDGDWPPPTSWLESQLPRVAKVAGNGRFELKLPAIPRDLQGQVTMTARIAALDPAGDRVEGRASVLLSEDGIAVSAVTEIGDGLVQGFNNRLYIRVTTPDGVVVPGAAVTVKRTWQGDDPGLAAVLDEDGVAALQIDPGAPVNVVIPALPYRPPPLPQLVTRDEPEELIGEEGAPLADQVEMDRWLAALSPCALWYDESDSGVSVGIRATTAGALTVVAAGSTPLDRCVVDTLARKRLPAGADRMYSLTFSFVDPALPRLAASVDGALEVPEGLETAVGELAMRARSCLPRDAQGSLPRALTWTAREGSKEVLFGGWIADPASGEEAAVSAMGCAQGRLTGARVALEEEASADSMGIVRFTVEPPEIAGEARPQPTTMLGYELTVAVELEGKPSTKLRLTPGEVPDLRLRVQPVLAKVGDKVRAELIRGPDFAATGRTLPKELVLEHLKGRVTAELDDKKQAEFTIPAGAEGWIEVSGGGARALVYVKPENDLAVAVKPKAERYAPGQQAELAITTELGGKGAKAAVGLIGVDESLGQLATLPGVDELARLRPQVETTTPAFGVLDGQALALGRVRGANAAAATILKVGAIPRPPELDAVVSAQGETTFDPIAELTDNFYNVLAELHVQVRAWEQSAPPAEQMKPETMVRLWQQALDACARRKEPVVDAWGRRLRLSRLPDDLLMLTDPRVVVAVGTRLPEDVESWTDYVRKGNK